LSKFDIFAEDHVIFPCGTCFGGEGQFDIIEFDFSIGEHENGIKTGGMSSVSAAIDFMGINTGETVDDIKCQISPDNAGNFSDSVTDNAAGVFQIEITVTDGDIFHISGGIEAGIEEKRNSQIRTADITEADIGNMSSGGQTIIAVF
jgi:hypothetical protein